MRIIVFASGPLQGTLGQGGFPDLPGDKSMSHRAALFAALAQGTSRIENFQISGVTRVMLNALTALGVRWELNGTALTVHGAGLNGLIPPETPINCGNSATTMRLLAGAIAAAGIPAVLDGSDSLRRRPMDRIIQPLQQMGVSIQSSTNGTAPLILGKRPTGHLLSATNLQLPVASAQVKTCLLLAGLAADGALTLTEPGPSRDHSERMLASMGASLERSCLTNSSASHPVVTLQPLHNENLSALNMRLPGDFSAAAFLLVAGTLVPGSSIALHGVGLNPTRTGLSDALQQMGARIELQETGIQAGEPVGSIIIEHSALSGIRVRGDLVVRMIDEFPAFSIAAACAYGLTSVSDAAELRTKESDRIQALIQELSHLDIQAIETSDGFIIEGPQSCAGGTVSPHRDHRLAMSLAVAGLIAKAPVVIQEAEIISESFPDFIKIMRNLGARIEITDD